MDSCASQSATPEPPWTLQLDVAVNSVVKKKVVMQIPKVNPYKFQITHNKTKHLHLLIF